ncbi:GNAT family N-acetyltransferase [Spirochaeta isovalerica]|uniref:Ribosomal protein S18 acetylase RimI-like enzyme n=1 Tax=Spirochaeta isovalerica TaxID=150 RepID=A0A841RBY9_9SPIO|nr:GNAT family N-acetyltransferase [Spirochaeta isovalerica]MBB6480409.1 ribosomal protein S18 acetylase RimI-like enzyme [Spirochaeta isovalerica]
MIEIRPYELTDLPYLYEICWKTALNGNSVEGVIDDKYKVGHYFAAPYVYFDRDCCFVVTRDNIPAGYIVGTADTVGYTKWLNSEWLPKVRRLYDIPSESSEPFQQFINDCIKNDTLVDKSLSEYPGHLHIDLLPELQGKGLGRKLMEMFFNSCRRKGTEGVHLGVSKQNPGAVAFYRKMGMFVISESEGAYMMGILLL